MQLFKSEWMIEPTAAASALDLRRSRCDARYGSARRAAVRAVCSPLPAFDELPAPALVEHERAVLRRLAELDRAA